MISLMESKDNLPMSHLCEKILDFDGVRFVGVIDKMGNVVSERFMDGVVPFENDAKRRMLYMQMVLEITMRREFDSSLGSVNYITSHRKKSLMISIPFYEYVILVSTLHDAEIQKIVSQINDELNGDIFRKGMTCTRKF